MTATNLSLAYFTHPPAIYRQQMPGIWDQRGSETVGPDSEKRNGEADIVIKHWWSRPTLILLAAQSEDIPYEHVALTPGRMVKTRYRYIGRLPARTIPEAD